VDAVEVLRNALELNLAHAEAVIDAAVFDGQVARALAETEEQARTVARQIADSAPDIFVTWTQPQHRVDGLVLVIPSKADSERDAVANAWQLAGGGPAELLRRTVSVERLGHAGDLAYPGFLKPVVPKQFGARIFESFAQLQAETNGLDDSTEILRSDIITIVAEARSFVLDGVVQACALYEGTGNADAAAKTCERVAMALDLPRAAVLDVGLLDSGEWVFIEANAAWGAGLNGCDAHDVLACIAAASKPNER
jgi:hypothetical protein